jgi:hypothetical protein
MTTSWIAPADNKACATKPKRFNAEDKIIEFDDR